MPERTYVVLGASGHVGGTIAARLLDAGSRVRVVARSAEKLRAHAGRGAEAATGDVTDAAFLRRALDGAGAAFVLLPPYFGPGVRAWQDRLAGLLGDALEAARVPRAVTLSSIGAERASGNGPIAGLHALEARLDRIPGLAPLHLRPGYFFENHLAAIPLVKAAGMTAGATRGDLRTTPIATRDIGEVAARRLLALDWSGREVMELHGERDLTMQEVTAALGKAIGKPDLPYVHLSYADAQQGLVKAGLSDEMAGLFVELARGFNEGTIRPTQPRSAATTTPTSIERFATEVFAPAYRGA